MLDKLDFGKIGEYLGDKVPNLIDFAFSVLLALVTFFVGAKGFQTQVLYSEAPQYRQIGQRYS